MGSATAALAAVCGRLTLQRLWEIESLVNHWGP